MKDLIILSDKSITRDSCIDLLKECFKDYNILNDDETTFYCVKKRRRFELWFSPEDLLDDPNNMMDNTNDRCPNKKAYLTNLS